MSGERQLNLGAALGLWAALGFAAAFYGTWLGYGGRRLAVTLAVFAFFLAVELLLAARGVRERILDWSGTRARSALIPAAAPFLAYLVYALGTDSFRWWRVALAAGYVLLPALLAVWCRQAKPGTWQDYLVILALFAPVKFRWLIRYLWPYPEGRLGYILTILLALSVGIAVFLFLRRLEGVGYTLGWGRGWGFQVFVNFLILAAILIPLGQAIGFIRFGPAWANFKTLPTTALGIFLFTAWPEEFLFRGVLQNLLSRTLRDADLGWIAASVLFGFAHIPNQYFPNWKYVFLATLAGIFYGRTWRKTGSLFPAALVHGLVDVSWHLFFRTL